MDGWPSCTPNSRYLPCDWTVGTRGWRTGHKCVLFTDMAAFKTETNGLPDGGRLVSVTLKSDLVGEARQPLRRQTLAVVHIITFFFFFFLATFQFRACN